MESSLPSTDPRLLQKELGARPMGAGAEAFRASDLLGAGHLIVPVLLTLAGFYAGGSAHWLVWFGGQILLSFAFLSWFAVLHEAGHKTLFQRVWLNTLTGHVAGILAILPFANWKQVHALHHRWTGWHDLDPTTSQSLPHEPGPLEKFIVNTSWRLWIPTFSIAYRLATYWNVVWLWKRFPRSSQRRQLALSLLICLSVYIACGLWLGWQQLFVRMGLGLYLSLVMQDLLILSQHTHIPMPQSQGEKVRPFPPLEQEQFTRSLVFPSWFARFVLLNLDAHELHHMYPRIPGYHLHAFDQPTQNAIPWWQWIWEAKRLPAHILLFRNRTMTGYTF